MRRSNNGSYRAISAIGAIIRTVYLANAFEYYFGNDGLQGLIALAVNATIGEMLLKETTYSVVGIIYTEGEAPTLGSILYSIFYIINNFIMIGICNFCKLHQLELYIVIVFYLIVWILLSIALSIFRNKNYDF